MAVVAYLVLENPSARNNLGTLIRCAAAFAVEELVVVGASKWSTHGAHGSHKHVKYRWFDDWATAASFLRTERGCDLCGIVRQSTSKDEQSTPKESSANTAQRRQDDVRVVGAERCPTACAETVSDGIDDASDVVGGKPTEVSKENSEEISGGRPDELSDNTSSEEDQRYIEKGAGCPSTAVRHRPFRRSTAFFVGHNNRLEDEALGLCDSLVHVEQTDEFPMKLSAPVTVSIALHHFTAWARYEERQFTGEKFDVDTELARCRPPTDENATAKERARLREERRTDDPLEAQEAIFTNGTQDNTSGAGLGWFAKDDDGDQPLEGDY